jgi:LMBR1 domain-containing protein 1
MEENPILYYTSKEGYVIRVDNVSSRTIWKRLTGSNKEDEGEGTSEPVVVMKKPVNADVASNHTNLLNAKQFKAVLESISPGQVLFQKYIKCKGPKACIARVIYGGQKPCYGYMISNKKSTQDTSEKEMTKRLLINTENPNSLSIYKMTKSALAELVSVTENLVRYTQNTQKPRVTFHEFVADFIRDEDGDYKFLQVKAVILDEARSAMNEEYDDNGSDDGGGQAKRKQSKNKAEYMRLKECKMCLNSYAPHELAYTMSLKMIYATENHLKRRAVRLAWFDRPEFNSVTDTSMWYQAHKVCKNCFDMYLQEQKLAKVEVEFAKAIGIPVNERQNEGASIISTLHQKLGSRRSKLRQDENIVQHRIPQNLLMFRFITYLNELRNIPDNIVGRITLRMNIFGAETIVPIRMENHRKIIPIGKLRVFYLFAPDIESFRKWIQDYKQVTVNLYAGEECLGYSTLALKQFASGLIDKLDYMVLFSSSKLKLCSLRATLGFAQMKSMNLSNVKLEPWNGVYIPPDDFFTADPLPDEWMEIIPRLTTQLPLDNLNKSAARPSSSASHLEKQSVNGARKRPQSAAVVPSPQTNGSIPGGQRQRPQSAILAEEAYSRPGSASRVLKRRASSVQKNIAYDRQQFNITRPQSRSSSSASSRRSPSPAPQITVQNNFSSGAPKRPMSAPTHKKPPRPGSAPAHRPSSSLVRPLPRAASPSHHRIVEPEETSYENMRNDDIENDIAQDVDDDIDDFDEENLSPKNNQDFASDISPTENYDSESAIPSAQSSPQHNRQLVMPSFQVPLQREKVVFRGSDTIWQITIKIPSVHELASIVDESWIMTFDMLGTSRAQYESFQLFSTGPLVFDVEHDIFFCCSEQNLVGYFTKERVFKIVLTPKYHRDDERVAAVDMRNVFKSTPYLLDQDVPVEKIRSEDVDNTKFMEEDSDDDDDPDEDEEKEGDKDKEQTHARMKVHITVNKLGTVHDVHKRTVGADLLQAEGTVPDFQITILKQNPLPPDRTLTGSTPGGSSALDFNTPSVGFHGL